MNESSARPKLWLAWLGTFLLFVSVAHGNFETTDAGFTMHAARSLWHRGDSALLTAAEGGELEGEQAGAFYIKKSERDGVRKSGKIGVNGHAYVWYPMGHVFLLVPFIALGEGVAKLLPDADQILRRTTASFAGTYREGHPVVTQGLISLLLPSLCIATSILLLYRIARELGASGRDAALAALTIGFATQAFSLGREQLSDGPGLMLLLAALLPVLRICRATDARHTAWWAGLMSGAAVLLRYQTALAVVVFAVLILAACSRRGSYRSLWLFAAGGAPMLFVFLLTNYLRFGSPLITGYPEVGDWFTAQPHVGLTKILLGAGRGILWFSPILWLGIPLAVQRSRAMAFRGLAWVLFVTPLAIFMTAQGWQGGQAWAIRYVTPGVVALLAIVLPQTRPWQRFPKVFWALVVLGCIVNLTSVVAPVRGQIQLASQAVRADRAQALAAGLISAAEASVDPADYGGWHPRFTPLLANWRYALRSCVGGFEDEAGRPRHGGSNGIEPLYGVTPNNKQQGFVPMHWTDRCGRHLWWRFWGDLYGVSSWLLLLPVLLLAGVCGWFGWRSLAASSDSSTGSSPAG